MFSSTDPRSIRYNSSLAIRPIRTMTTNEPVLKRRKRVIVLEEEEAEDDDEHKQKLLKFFTETVIDYATCPMCLIPITELSSPLALLCTICDRPVCLECIVSYYLSGNISNEKFLPQVTAVVEFNKTIVSIKDYEWTKVPHGKSCPFGCECKLDYTINPIPRGMKQWMQGYLLLFKKKDYIEWNTQTYVQKIPCRFCNKKDCFWTIKDTESSENIDFFMGEATRIEAPKQCSCLLLKCSECNCFYPYKDLNAHIDEHRQIDTTEIKFTWIRIASKEQEKDMHLKDSSID
jgi:hypothetical protein